MTTEGVLVNLEKEVTELENLIQNASSDEIEKLVAQNKKMEYRLKHVNMSIEEEKKFVPKSNLPDMDYSKCLSPGSMLKHAFTSAIHKAFPSEISHTAVIDKPKNEYTVDYQCNSALSLSRKLKQKPQETAKIILENLPASIKPFLESTEVQGPGFINIKFLTSWISERAISGFTEEFPSGRCTSKKQKMIIDYSSPNIAKDMHVGHLRSTIIGDALGNLFDYLDYNVMRLNHVGDWGTQFGMLIAHLQDSFPDYATKCPSIQDLQAFYKESKKRFDEEPDFKIRAYKLVVQLQSKEQGIITAWQAICEASRNNFEKIYKDLNISPDLKERGESFYQEGMEKLMYKLKDDGVMQYDEGRYIYFPKGCEIPLTLIKSDGGFTYDSSDLTALKQRVEEEKADVILYVTDAGQSTHFQTCFAAAKELGIYNDDKTRVVHVPFGVVLGEDKKKFKTRSGETVKLSALLQEAKDRAGEIMKERAELQNWTEEEYQTNKRGVAMSSVKYSDLASNREKAYIFSFDKMISFKGNTGAYLCYAYTRIQSILRKVDAPEMSELQAWTKNVDVSLKHQEERKLAKKVLQWYDKVDLVEKELYMHVLCDWLYDLATSFTKFYDNCYVLEVNKETGEKVLNKDRLILVALTSMIMKKAFKVLGFLPTSRM
jgi:arginyl-tRNA synthetase